MKSNELSSAQSMYQRLVEKAAESNKGIEESAFNEAIEMRMRQALKDHIPRADHMQVRAPPLPPIPRLRSVSLLET